MNDFIHSLINVQLRASDFDWSQYVNNSKYLQLLEQGRWHWAENNNLNLIDSKIIGVVSKMNINYLVPIAWNPVKTIFIETKIKVCKKFSIILNQKIIDETKVYADAEVTLTVFNLENKRLEKVSTIIKGNK